MDRGNIPDLTFLGTQLAIFQKSQQPNIWELMNSFVLLTLSFAASRILLQQLLLTSLNFTLDSQALKFEAHPQF